MAHLMISSPPPLVDRDKLVLTEPLHAPKRKEFALEKIKKVSLSSPGSRRPRELGQGAHTLYFLVDYLAYTPH